MIGVAVAFVAQTPAVLLSGPALFFILLLVVGGPASLAYLWPVLTDPKQRPSTSEFAGADGSPFSLKSIGMAAVSGAIGIGLLVATSVSGTFIYWLVVSCVFTTGALFLGVGILAYLSIDEPAVRLYSSAIIGGIGVVLCLVGVGGI